MQSELAIEFPQLATGVFADYGGSSPISQSQVAKIEEYATDLSLFYNIGGKKSKAQQEIDAFKHELLQLFHVDENQYEIFFYNNTSAAIRALAYSFPFGAGGKFIEHADTHNSILGIRKIALARGAEVQPVGSYPKTIGKTHNLFAYSLESNFSGRKYPLDWCNQFISQSKPEEGLFCHVLLDAAAYVPTCDLDLSKYPAQYVVFSLLKMFGSPGGVLLVRKEAMAFLPGLTQLPFDEISVIAARSGLEVRKSIEKTLGMPISEYVFELANNFASRIKDLKHYNGKPAFELYPAERSTNPSEQGGIVAFNLRNVYGGPVPHDGIFTCATANNIFVRFGVHCNPGGTYMALGWKPADIYKATRAHEASCSLTASIMEGRHVGSVRVSFGYQLTQNDIDRLVEFFESHFVEKEPVDIEISEKFPLKSIYIHPVKGCQGFEVKLTPENPKWKLVATGLQYDSCWAIADELSTLLDRTRCPLLARFTTEISDNTLKITSPDGRSISVPANEAPKGTDFTSSTVCHEKISGVIYGPEVNEWFTEVLGRKAILVKVSQREMNVFRCFFTESMKIVSVKEIEQIVPHFIFESHKPFEEDKLLGKDVLFSNCEFYVQRRIPATTEMMIDCQKPGELPEPLKSICLLHSPAGGPIFGLEIIGKFRPSRKNPKEIELGSELVIKK